MILSAFLCGTALAADWQSLVDGRDLRNWRQVGGNAQYRLEDDVLAGTSAADTPNSFLVTRDTYSDFILEFEVLVDPELNSGVQIRSHVGDTGVVQGYQIEIDPTRRAFSGGIYDEQRRHWLYPLSRNEKGRRAFRNGRWNRFRVEAIGHSIRTWVNGIQTADLVDDMTADGFIGLQVHS
ncbi:MAG: 3-keto-disaccharide hydrolase, partial [Woeseiaceae bacterium]